MWPVSVGRLAVRAVVRRSCYLTTNMCPFDNCQEEETQKDLLLEGHRSREVWGKTEEMGPNANINYRSFKRGPPQPPDLNAIQNA